MKSSLLTLLAVLGFSVPAYAAEVNTWGAGIGYFDILDNYEQDSAGDVRLEYRWGRSLVPSWERYVNIRPFAGVEVTTDGAVYGLGGLLFDVPLSDSLYFTPSFGAGLFGDFDGKEMGSIIEFRSQAEVAYRFNDQSRVGLAFGHISNAGITERNPGSEILTLYYHMPVPGSR